MFFVVYGTRSILGVYSTAKMASERADESGKLVRDKDDVLVLGVNMGEVIEHSKVIVKQNIGCWTQDESFDDTGLFGGLEEKAENVYIESLSVDYSVLTQTPNNDYDVHQVKVNSPIEICFE